VDATADYRPPRASGEKRGKLFWCLARLVNYAQLSSNIHLPPRFRVDAAFIEEDRMRLKSLAGLAGLLVLTSTAPALVIMMPPAGAHRVPAVDCVIVGKVTSIEAKPVMATRFPGDMQKGEFTVAVVKVEEGIYGAKGMTSIRVAFPTPLPEVPGPGPRPIVRPPIRRFPPIKLEVGQEVCLFVVKHPEEPFYTIQANTDILNKKDNPNFAKTLEPIKQAAKLLADPQTGFASKDAEERFLTAALLVVRYQTARPTASGQPKLEPISAEESKQILQALAEADWAKPLAGPQFMAITPLNIFNRLQNKPGWTPPKDFRQFPDEAKKWLKANAETYRVQKYVSSEKPAEK
jgi:hypothetical protein